MLPNSGLIVWAAPIHTRYGCKALLHITYVFIGNFVLSSIPKLFIWRATLRPVVWSYVSSRHGHGQRRGGNKKTRKRNGSAGERSAIEAGWREEDVILRNARRKDALMHSGVNPEPPGIRLFLFSSDISPRARSENNSQRRIRRQQRRRGNLCSVRKVAGFLASEYGPLHVKPTSR